MPLQKCAYGNFQKKFQFNASPSRKIEFTPAHNIVIVVDDVVAV